MRIQVVAVGNKMPKWTVEGTQEYTKRFPSECQLYFTEIVASKRSKGINVSKILDEEGKKCLQAVPKGNKIITLEVTGQSWDTPALAKQLENWKMSGRDISLLIGGPEGLSKECIMQAEQRWSLSPLTLPHPMVRVIVAESLYRAWSVTQNHPYHRD